MSRSCTPHKERPSKHIFIRTADGTDEARRTSPAFSPLLGQVNVPSFEEICATEETTDIKSVGIFDSPNPFSAPPSFDDICALNGLTMPTEVNDFENFTIDLDVQTRCRKSDPSARDERAPVKSTAPEKCMTKTFEGTHDWVVLENTSEYAVKIEDGQKLGGRSPGNISFSDNRAEIKKSRGHLAHDARIPSLNFQEEISPNSLPACHDDKETRGNSVRQESVFLENHGAKSSELKSGNDHRFSGKTVAVISSPGKQGGVVEDFSDGVLSSTESEICKVAESKSFRKESRGSVNNEEQTMKSRCLRSKSSWSNAKDRHGSRRERSKRYGNSDRSHQPPSGKKKRGLQNESQNRSDRRTPTEEDKLYDVVTCDITKETHENVCHDPVGDKKMEQIPQRQMALSPSRKTSHQIENCDDDLYICCFESQNCSPNTKTEPYFEDEQLLCDLFPS